MRAVRYHETGGSEVLEVEEIARPDPARDEVLIEVHAAGINPVDTKFREGTYDIGKALPHVPGGDVAGVVEAVGPGVTDFEPGDRVFGTNLGIDRDGSCAEYTLATPDHIAHLPENVGFEEGAGVAAVGVTAWQGFLERSDLRPGETVLVHGGNGGVGHVSVQLAAAMSCTVIATAAPEYHDRLRDLGADAVIDYSRDDLADAITDVGAPDVVMNHMVGEYLQLDTDVGAPGHRIVVIGGALDAGYENAGMARGKNQTVNHMAIITLDDVGSILANLASLMTSGDLSAEVARTYDLDEVARAHEDVLGDSFLGKLVVVP